jgi:hypothetical protein
MAKDKQVKTLFFLTFLIHVKAFAVNCGVSKQDTIDFLKLHLGNNSNISKISDLEEITSLDLGMKCTGDIAINHSCNLPNLTSLFLYNDNCKKEDQLSGDNFELLSELKKLTFVDFDFNSIKTSNMPKLNKVPNLKSLKVLGNQFGLQDLTPLSELKIENVIAGKNEWEKSSPEEIARMLTNIGVKKFSFSGYQNSNSNLESSLSQSLSHVTELKSLQSIILNSEVDGISLANFLNRTNIKYFNCTKIVNPEGLRNLELNHSLKELNCPIDSIEIVKSYPLLTELKEITLNDFKLEYIDLLRNSNITKIQSEQKQFGDVYLHYKNIVQYVSELKNIKFIFNKVISTEFVELQNGEVVRYTLKEGVQKLSPICDPDQCYVNLSLQDKIYSFEQYLEL